MNGYVREYYRELFERKRVASVPVAQGRALAEELGYPAAVISRVSEVLWEDFLACGYVLDFLNPEPGKVILNLGCGVCVDAFALAAIEASMRVVNLDTALPALGKAYRIAEQTAAGPGRSFVCGDGGSLPFATKVFDAVLLNGVFNLFADKVELAGELSRVLKTGGTVAGADLCRRAPLPAYFQTEPDAWVWLMGGALSGEEMSAVFETARFRRTEFVTQEMDEFFDRVLFVFEKTG